MNGSPPSGARGPTGPRGAGPRGAGPGTRFGIAWLLAVLAFTLLLLPRLAREVGPRTIPYSEFRRHLAAGEVASVVVGEDELTGTLRPPVPEVPAPTTPAPTTPATPEPAPPEPVPPEPTTPAASASVPPPFRAVRVEDPELVADLARAGVEYSGARNDGWSALLLPWLLPLGLMALFLWSLRASARGVGGAASLFGKSSARLVPESGTGVTFEDVAGCDEAKGELSELVEFLRDPARFTVLGARIPKGVLLLGPPGTGKTLLARAVAGEARVPFFLISGSDFVEMFVGVGAARVRDLFVQAKAKAPCIVFIDEIDAVGRQRGVSMGVVNDEREQTLNQLLSEMDGFEPNAGVILLAATNRPEVLDRALLRPGRFDRQVVLDAPDRRGRLAILRVHARAKPIAAGVDLDAVARVTPGFAGADLANVVNEAALGAARAGRTEIGQAELEEAIERVVAGPERRSRRLTAAEKRRVAVHESGHALVAATSEHADPVRKISIVPRGRAALGYTLQIPEQEQLLATRSELEDRLAVLLGGRAAEELVLGEVSTGAQDDLETATGLARRMACLFGMNARLGLGTCAVPEEGRFLAHGSALRLDCSPETARWIDEEVRASLERAHGRARALLERNRRALDAVTRRLLEQETLEREAFEALVAAEGDPARAPAPAPAVA